MVGEAPMIGHHAPRPPGRRFSLARAAALLVLVSAAAAWLWAHEGHPALPGRGVSVDAGSGRVVLAPDAVRALDVRLGEVVTGSVAEEVVAPAAVVAPWPRHAYASTPLGGKVAVLRARPGDRVRRGQVVAEVESLELEDLRRELLDAQNDVRLSTKALARFDDPNVGGAIPERTQLQARSRHRQNLVALDFARRKLLAVGLSADAVAAVADGRSPGPLAVPVVSPLDGTVVAAFAGVGQVVEPLARLLEVVELSRVWVQVRVLEKDLPRVARGSPVAVRVAGSPGGERSGTVAVRERYLDPVTHWATAWAELDNADRRLLPGMAGRARVGVAAGAPGLVLPSEALARVGADCFVLVEEGPGQYRRRAVVVRRERGGSAEVAPDTDLFPGDRVVTTGSHEMASLFVPGTLRPGPETARAIGLRVEPAARRGVADVLTTHGAVELPPGGRVVASARLAGTLDRIGVGPDQEVRAGDVVAEVASLEFFNLQLDLRRSHLQAELLADTLRRAHAASDVLPESLVRETEAAEAAARQRRDSLDNKLRAAGLSDAQRAEVREGTASGLALPVRAPAGGVVVRFRAVLGQGVRAEDPLFEVHDLAAVLLRADVPEAEVARVRVGQRVRVRLMADPAYTGEAVVTRLGQAVGSRDRTVPVWAELTVYPPTPLLPGMLARLSFVVAEPAPVLAVPSDAVLREGGHAFVFVRRGDGTFERRPVETGRDDGRLVEVTHGLAEGEPVAVGGVAGLQNAYASAP
jgi:RND family efflux transporter MFP subunit